MHQSLKVNEYLVKAKLPQSVVAPEPQVLCDCRYLYLIFALGGPVVVWRASEG